MANEKRLIELGEALRMIKNSKADCPETSIRGRAIWDTAHNCALSCLTSCHTVDAEPVVHGHWIKHNFLGHDQFVCSECQTIGSPQWKRCPVCEAKMDGGNEDGNL